jgi:hypothetical protein
MPYGLSDAIKIDAHTGGNDAGNGGDAYNKGDLYNYAKIDFDPTQKVYGADVHAHAGDFVHQYGEWDASGGKWSGGDGGTSNGNVNSTSGGDVAAVSANTAGTMTNLLEADQHASFVGAVGGAGGNGNLARGGDISATVTHSDPSTETITRSIVDSLNHNDIDFSLSHLT